MQLQLLKLLPNQIAEYWDAIRPVIEDCLPPITIESPDRMNLVLESFLDGRMELLIFYTPEDNRVVIRGAAAVTFDVTVGSDHKTMFIYSLYSLGNQTPRDWMYGFSLLKKYASGQGCKVITALTSNRGLIDFVERAGGNVSQTYLIMEV